MRKLILSAANKVRVSHNGVEAELTLVDCCHFGGNMQEIMKFLRDIGVVVDAKCSDLEDRGQGFIDESGQFHYRSESYEIAKSSGQLFNNKYTLPGNKLDSSCIRHIEDSDE